MGLTEEVRATARAWVFKSEYVLMFLALHLSSARMTDKPPILATPGEVADYLRTTTAALAQDRYRGIGPNFIKRGRRVLYRWSDVEDWLEHNTFYQTDERVRRGP